MNYAARILADRQEAGVTFDAFKGWAKSKQRNYLADHPGTDGYQG